MYKTKIQRGLALLTPEQIRSVNLQTLNQGHWSYCVLGQLYGDYQAGENALCSITELTARWRWGYEHGFLLDLQVRGWTEVSRRYRTLTLEWKTALIHARAGA
jgi:hypothetical protein